MRTYRALAAATIAGAQQRAPCACNGVFTIRQHQVRQAL